MSGLLSSAYPWGDSKTQNTKKRTPSLSISRNRTIKRNPQSVTEDEMPSDFKPLKNSNGAPFDSSTKLPVRFESGAPEARPNSNLHWFKPLSNLNGDFTPFRIENNTPSSNREFSILPITSNSSNSSASVNDVRPDSLQDTQETNQVRNSRVQEMIRNMNGDDAGQGLASFTPLPLFSESKPDPPTRSVATYPTLNSESHLGNSYYHAYSDKSKIGNIPAYSMDRIHEDGKRAGGAGRNKPHDPIMEKLNKMLYLLEEQQQEPTKHIMEEFILYTFLGVFIIFIVDSFSRSGKYIR